jgi:hypothetical protein
MAIVERGAFVRDSEFAFRQSNPARRLSMACTAPRTAMQAIGASDVESLSLLPPSGSTAVSILPACHYLPAPLRSYDHCRFISGRTEASKGQQAPHADSSGVTKKASAPACLPAERVLVC